MPTETRLARMQAVAEQRSNFITVLLDDVHDPHNLAAVLRSADAFGVRDVHAVETGARIRISNKIARGTQHWVNLYRYASARTALENLKKQGYAIWIAAASPDSRSLNDWRPDQPTAFVFGNEHSGVRPEIAGLADAQFEIPMVGMVESLNVSVATAITLYTARQLLVGASPDRLVSSEEAAELQEYWQSRDDHNSRRSKQMEISS